MLIFGLRTVLIVYCYVKVIGLQSSPSSICKTNYDLVFVCCKKNMKNIVGTIIFLNGGVHFLLVLNFKINTLDFFFNYRSDPK